MKEIRSSGGSPPVGLIVAYSGEEYAYHDDVTRRVAIRRARAAEHRLRMEQELLSGGRVRLSGG